MHHVLIFLLTFLQANILASFFFSYFSLKEQYKKRHSILYVCLCLIFSIVFFVLDFHWDCTIIIYCLLLSMVLQHLFDGKVLEKWFIVLSVLLTLVLSDMLLVSSVELLFQTMYFNVVVVEVILFLLLQGIMFFISLALRGERKKIKTLGLVKSRAIFVYLMFALLLYTLYRRRDVLVDPGAYSYNLSIVAFLWFLFLVCFMLVFYTQRDYEMSAETKFALEAQGYHVMLFQELEQTYKRYSKARHDLKHIQLYLAYLQQNTESKVLNNICEDLKKDADIIFTNYKLINYIVFEKQQEAKQKHIHIQYVMNVYENLPIEEMDFVVVLGNVLDNAMEHCVAKDTIKVKVSKCKNALYLCVSNPLHTLPTMVGDTFTSSKSGSCHGYGIENIKEIVEHCNAHMKIEVTDTTFRCSIAFSCVEE